MLIFSEVILNNFFFLFKNDKIETKRDSDMVNVIEVVAAVIVKENKFLAAKRKPGHYLSDKWEFPGGKIEPGETRADALKREIKEELGCDIEVEDHIHTAEYVAVTGKRIVLHFYRCHLRAGLPEPREHAAIIWVDESRLTQIPWAPADFEAVNIIIKNKGKELWI